MISGRVGHTRLFVFREGAKRAVRWPYHVQSDLLKSFNRSCDQARHRARGKAEKSKELLSGERKMRACTWNVIEKTGPTSRAIRLQARIV